MANKLLILYLGDDAAYFKALQGEFSEHAKTQLEFKQYFESNDSRIQSLFLKIFHEKPVCVFVDFSKHTQDYLHLARLISRTPFEHEMIMVGLVDYLSPIEVLKESIATGTHLNFIKSAETFDVVFSVMKKIAPQAIGEHGFAKASLNETWETGTPCKVGYVQNNGLHIETNYQLSKGDRLELDHHWLEKRMVPSKQVFVKNVSSTNMFYQFKFNADLDFLFIDEFHPVEGMSATDIEFRKNERTDLITYHKKQLKKWLEDNMSTSEEKRAKVLVVDYKFHFYQNQPRTDKHPYTIRCIPFFNDISTEIERLNPQIIAIEIDKENDGKNTVETLRRLVSFLSSRFTDLSPYIFVFNSEYSSQTMQETLQYAQVLAHESELDPHLLIKMADMLQKKLSSNKQENTVKKGEDSKVFLKKNHRSSMTEIIKSVTVVKLSETDMILQSDFPFPSGTNLHFHKPVEMFVNVTPVEKPSGKVPEFYGLIHSIGENEKKELRKYINSVFFRDHDAQLAAETDEFKKLNEAKLLERMATEKLAREAEDAKLKANEEESAPEIPEKTNEPGAV